MLARVVVAMSGGVDSSVAAALLVEQGYEVIGVMLRLWSEPAAAGGGEPQANRCCTLQSLHDARGVAERVGIPFYVVNAEAAFKAGVVDPFIAAYAAGRTPNPCLACNRKIRFGFLLDYALGLGASHLATGHYARIRRGADGRYQLLRGLDRDKDQSYVLSLLGQAVLGRLLLPLGELTKVQVRALAAARGLPTASRPESQDLCFTADGDYRGFIRRHAPESVRPGPILDRQGRQLGVHRGLPFYTIGQRSGLGIAAPEPFYVIALDPAQNLLVVGRAAELGRRLLRTGPVNWIAGEPPLRSRLAVQIRSRARPAPATVAPRPDGGAEVVLDEPLRDISPGQAAVFYEGEVCLGGGEIVGSEENIDNAA